VKTIAHGFHHECADATDAVDWPWLACYTRGACGGLALERAGTSAMATSTRCAAARSYRIVGRGPTAASPNSSGQRTAPNPVYNLIPNHLPGTCRPVRGLPIPDTTIGRAGIHDCSRPRPPGPCRHPHVPPRRPRYGDAKLRARRRAIHVAQDAAFARAIRTHRQAGDMCCRSRSVAWRSVHRSFAHDGWCPFSRGVSAMRSEPGETGRLRGTLRSPTGCPADARRPRSPRARLRCRREHSNLHRPKRYSRRRRRVFCMSAPVHTRRR